MSESVDMNAILKIAVTAATIIRNFVSSWPSVDRRTLGEQLIRASISVPSNLSENQAYNVGQEINFLRIALGSIAECRIQLRLAKSFRLIPTTVYDRVYQYYVDMDAFVMIFLEERVGSQES